MSADDREAYCLGLEKLAAVLRANPDLSLPVDGGSKYSAMTWHLFDLGEVTDPAGQKAKAAQIVRTLGGDFDKSVTADLFRFHGRVEGLHVQVIVNQAAVCERVVTGTTDITREVLDPEALAAVPKTTVTETVETVEWRCGSLLSAVSE